MTGHTVLDPVTHDRIPDLSLYNVQPAVGGSLQRVKIGQLPSGRISRLISNSTIQHQRSAGDPQFDWLDPGATIAWPGGRESQPVDGIETAEIATAFLFPSHIWYGQTSYCAAMLAERHLSSQDTTVTRAVTRASSARRLRLVPYDTGAIPSGGITALAAASEDGVAGLIGPLFSSVALPVAARASGIPMISPSAMSDALSDTNLFPSFARTHPANADVAAALLQVITSNFWTWRGLGVVYVSDAYGVNSYGFKPR